MEQIGSWPYKIMMNNVCQSVLNIACQSFFFNLSSCSLHYLFQILFAFLKFPVSLLISFLFHRENSYNLETLLASLPLRLTDILLPILAFSSVTMEEIFLLLFL